MNNKYSEKIKRQAIERHNCGEQITAIAKELSVSRTTIYRWIKNYEEGVA